ncbi:hypothetical protein CDAR_486831 [Caerostris darwini]|uniref:Uncharacterized protein n=1 Tax=Caerostris darwini TaxID=1538125 RepID=A0AAV4WIK0_9ARAC|nr:hypothetical protein CDAR_486831 [Caerostris darwini]
MSLRSLEDKLPSLTLAVSDFDFRSLPRPKLDLISKRCGGWKEPFWREQNAVPFAQRLPEVFLQTRQRFFRFILCKNKPDRPESRSKGGNMKGKKTVPLESLLCKRNSHFLLPPPSLTHPNFPFTDEKRPSPVLKQKVKIYNLPFQLSSAVLSSESPSIFQRERKWFFNTEKNASGFRHITALFIPAVITSSPETAQNVLEEPRTQTAEPHTRSDSDFRSLPRPKLNLISKCSGGWKEPFWREQNAVPFAQRLPQVFLHTRQRFHAKISPIDLNPEVKREI